MMKKLVITFLAAAGTLASSAVSASASEAQYTDIGTYINNYPISGFAVNGKVVIVAEDLRNYGFDVNWDPTSRALHINRNNATQLNRRDIYKPEAASGSKLADIAPSDITVDYNGNRLTSYALNGYTLIPINDFAAYVGSDQWDSSTRSYKIWIDGLSICDFQPIPQRCRNLWYNINYSHMPDLSFWEDMDCDGVAEYINLTTRKDFYSDLYANLKIGNNSTGDFLKGMFANVIQAVYIMDIIPDDNAKEIAVFTDCDSSDPVIQIFRYSGGSIKALNFSYWTNGEGNTVTPYKWMGYVKAFPFNLHDDGTFTLQLKTTSHGMWALYQTFRIDKYGNIVLIPQDYYTVVPNSWYGDNQWGYYPVYKTIRGNGLTLNKGDWIKAVYDDGNENIYIQKSNGANGWFLIDGYKDSFAEYSTMFIMAD